MSQRKGIPSGFNEDTMRAVREVIENIIGERGDPMDTAVTRGDLVRAGLIKLSAGGQIVPVRSGEGGTNIELEPLANLQASAVGTNIILQWEGEIQEGLDHTEVWRSQTDNIEASRLIARAPGSIYSDPVGAGNQFWYWVRPVSSAGDKFSFNTEPGTPAQT